MQPWLCDNRDVTRPPLAADATQALETLDFRIELILPEEYQETYDTLQPTPMRAAGLKFDADGRVAWDEIWGSFCNLAIAGGPPHKGTLLAAGSPDGIRRDAAAYTAVVAEICRGITMVTGLAARAADTPGWIAVTCPDDTTAAWLLRAIVVENVAVRTEGSTLFLPAAPTFRLDKEIKNVVTVFAKTSHYWTGHMSGLQRAALGRLFDSMRDDEPLVTPAWSATDDAANDAPALLARLARRIEDATGRPRSGHGYPGWLGLEYPSVHAAVWMMRALVVHNVLSRREGGVVFVPVNPADDPGGDRVVETLAHVHTLAQLRRVL
jgi:sirohydrochlorin cobaltochelatase